MIDTRTCCKHDFGPYLPHCLQSVTLLTALVHLPLPPGFHAARAAPRVRPVPEGL
ncbi:MAG: hypothetical protein M0Q54_11250 [Pigmentiphaga sp.]|nr:hypothetical protein [Pigmentiphaga sp.]